MTGYSVRFYKAVLSSDGHQFTSLQREIPVLRSESAGEALDFAVRRFEELEKINDWKLHADFCSVEPKFEYQLARVHAEQGAQGAVRAATTQTLA